MYNDPTLIDEMLGKVRTIAVVGMSDKPNRASHQIGMYLAGKGYYIAPVNPNLAAVMGIRCYPDLDVAQTAAQRSTCAGIDLVNVFRAPRHVPAIVDDVIRLGIPYLWLQDGVIHDQAIARARAAGVQCVMDDCIYRRHAARLNLRPGH
jgi:predicted CoA-binding protein